MPTPITAKERVWGPMTAREKKVKELLLTTTLRGKELAHVMGLNADNIKQIVLAICRKEKVKGRVELLVKELARARGNNAEEQ